MIEVAHGAGEQLPVPGAGKQLHPAGAGEQLRAPGAGTELPLPEVVNVGEGWVETTYADLRELIGEAFDCELGIPVDLDRQRSGRNER